MLTKLQPFRTLFLCIASLGLLTCATQWAYAQGGPPLVTDDPETPGNGHWEINIGAIGTHQAGRWEVAAPDADINYGWGEHIQLKVDVPWTFIHESGERWKSGVGAANVGIKWRFIDIEDSGFSMSTYPQVAWSWLSSSVRRGIAGSGRQVFLPVEASTVVGGFGLDAEIGRNFVSRGQDEWAAGGVVAHTCGENLECMVELRETWAPHNSHTLANFGVHWKLNESTVLLAAAGRQFGARTDDRVRFLTYVGVQFLR